jgi:hypothetical protein
LKESKHTAIVDCFSLVLFQFCFKYNYCGKISGPSGKFPVWEHACEYAKMKHVGIDFDNSINWIGYKMGTVINSVEHLDSIYQGVPLNITFL